MTPALLNHPITAQWPPQHPERLQLYSLATPNGVKVSIALEEMGLPYEAPTIRHGGIELDPAARTVRLHGQLVDMSPREFSVLRVLLEARGHVLSRQQIEERLYSWDAAIESNAVEVHIHHLRRKLGSGSILTMRGVGYFIPQEAA